MKKLCIGDIARANTSTSIKKANVKVGDIVKVEVPWDEWKSHMCLVLELSSRTMKLYSFEKKETQIWSRYVKCRTIL
jgi:hypothetical protein